MDEVPRNNRKITLSESEICRHIQTLGGQPDLTIVSGNTYFKVHSEILAPASTYMCQLFVENPSNNFNIFMNPNVTPLDVENILTYIYQAWVKVTPDRKEGFREAAKQLHIDSLRDETDDVDKIASDDIDTLNQPISHCHELSDGTFTVAHGKRMSATILEGHIEDSNDNRIKSNGIEPKLCKPRQLTPYKHLEADKDTFPANDTVRRILKNVSAERTQTDVTVEVPKTRKHSSTNGSHLKQKQTKKLRVDKSEDMPSIQKRLGRPLLSSTKLSPNDPKVPDKTDKEVKMNPVLREKARLLETGSDSDVEDNLENNFNKGQENDSAEALNPGFKIADLVERKTSQEAGESRKNEPNNNLTFAVSPTPKDQIMPVKQQEYEEGSSKDNETKMNEGFDQTSDSKMSFVSYKPENKRKQLKRLSRVTSTINSTKHASKGARRWTLKQTKAYSKLIPPTDESSDANIINYKLKRKLPLEMRRRKVAKNRPELLDASTTTTNTSAALSPIQRPKFRKKLRV